MTELPQRRHRDPVSDKRTIENPDAPGHNSLNTPRGNSLQGSTSSTLQIPKPTLLPSSPTGSDYSRRESARPFGEEYVDVETIVRDQIQKNQIEAGNGLVDTNGTFSVGTALPMVTSLGTLTGLSVSGPVSTPLQYLVPTDGSTVTASSNYPGIILNPAAAVALTVVFPASPANGQHFSLHTTHDVTLTATATFATNNQPPSSITAGTALRYIYSSGLSAWVAA